MITDNMNETVLQDDSKETEKPNAKPFNWGTVKTPDKKPEKVLSELDNLMKGYTDKTTFDSSAQSSSESDTNDGIKVRRKRRKAEPVVISGEILTGALFLTVIDLLLPMLITTANNVIDKKNKVNPMNLKLSQTQKNELEPIANAVMKELELKANPMLIMIISLFAIYGMNFVKAKYDA